MMVAIVILGMGLLMAGAMFPAGWSKARDLSEYTTHISAANSAEITIGLLTRSAHRDSPYESSFRGDDKDPTDDTELGAFIGDTFVHPIHLETALVDTTGPGTEGLISLGRVGEYLYEDGTDASVESMNDAFTRTPLRAVQVALRERTVPPLPPMPEQREEVKHWYGQLMSRRYAWSAFNRVDPLPAGVDATGYETRSMTMYFVTLRRSHPENRYARQLPRIIGGAKPDLFPRSEDESNDVLFPVPWLVTYEVLGNWDTSGAALPATGIPTQLKCNVLSQAPGRLAAQMIATGSVLIDRKSGQIYTVRQHRFTGTGDQFDHSAIVTLDREMTLEDVDDDADGHVNVTGSLFLSNREDFRDFWIFPPPVVPGRSDIRYPTFKGGQPVVSIETRHMTFSP